MSVQNVPAGHVVVEEERLRNLEQRVEALEEEKADKEDVEGVWSDITEYVPQWIGKKTEGLRTEVAQVVQTTEKNCERFDTMEAEISRIAEDQAQTRALAENVKKIIDNTEWSFSSRQRKTIMSAVNWVEDTRDGDPERFEADEPGLTLMEEASRFGKSELRGRNDEQSSMRALTIFERYRRLSKAVGNTENRAHRLDADRSLLSVMQEVGKDNLQRTEMYRACRKLDEHTDGLISWNEDEKRLLCRDVGILPTRDHEGT